MHSLLNFLFRLRTFGLFLLLEGLCAWLIIVYNNQYNAAFLNSSNSMAAGISQISRNTGNYFALERINEQLVEENKRLRDQLAHQALTRTTSDTLHPYFKTFKAKVINNTYRRSLNYITLDVGLDDGVKKGMGVISEAGIVGQVKSVSRNFSTVTSLLHLNLMVSSSLLKTKTLCTTQWDGISPLQAELKFIPRHIPISIGDTVTTSGFNSVFPDGIMIGTIAEFQLSEEDPFYQVRINLATDFTSLYNVYVIPYEYKEEKDSIEAVSEQF